ncbi:hypothetical protein [Roseibium sp. MMSF_3544]|uniref:hypothetical protein n=1 Tax=unclassified Roseibium TaxID=2629323 RepID=UPI00273E65E7|nr:hypothetical protein [Roseibium sp. MMSF_3544]
MRPLRTYDNWKHCITDICKVPLTADYVAARSKELRDTQNFDTKKFVGSWGEPHRQRVVAGFEQAETEFAGDGSNKSEA